ncbi:hypothetical protein N7467_004273 [Penicillium canescens]|nr:hypothetical protein N7467_004273 [Penicillium canescens]
MQAIVFNGPLEYDTRHYVAGKTSSNELHVFRGHQASNAGFVMGHEFTGEIVEMGSDVQNFQKGDRVVSPFTVSCGKCFYCDHGYSSRCTESKLFGTIALDGGQAEYVRVPLADSTLFRIPSSVDEKKLVLMADIFPTGYFASSNAFSGLSQKSIRSSTVLLLGCGPVGICAIIAALEHKPKSLIAIDSVQSRLSLAQSLGAEPWNFENDEAGLRQRVKELTEGRGADVVIEVVGHSSALRMGFDLLRPWGRISSVGVHNQEIPWSGNEAYGKNLHLQMGRCPVRSIFSEAMALFEKKQEVLNFMSHDIRPLSQAVQAYDDFSSMRAHKVIFDTGAI